LDGGCGSQNQTSIPPFLDDLRLAAAWLREHHAAP